MNRLIPVLLVLSLTACDCNGADEQTDDPAPADDEPAHHDHTDLPDVTDLTDPGAHPDRNFAVSDYQPFEACHDILEQDGQPTDWPGDHDDVALTLFGCNADGHLPLDDGGWAAAFETPMQEDDRATDLRIAVYDADGTLRWHQLVDRSHRLDNFAAGYRGSFLTDVGDDLICAGTRWLDTTQASCHRLETGDTTWAGRMDFRAGTGMFGFDGSLFGTDTDGITRRYPYSGTEMRHRAFDEAGGASSYFAHNDRRIFYGPGEDHPYVEAWSLETFDRIWRTDLPAAPQRRFDQVVADHDLVLLLVDDRLVGLDAADGSLRMALEIDDDQPRIAHSDDHLFAMVRPGDDGPWLYALDPADGTVDWAGDAPAGSRAIEHRDDQILTRSVRTVRTVTPRH